MADVPEVVQLRWLDVKKIQGLRVLYREVELINHGFPHDLSGEEFIRMLVSIGSMELQRRLNRAKLWSSRP